MRKPTFKIAFVGNYEFHCGSSNALLGYVKAGKNLGYDIRVSEFGNIDEIVRSSIPVANKTWKPDLMVIVYESYPFLSKKDLAEICTRIPRSKRIVIDPDGKYSKPVGYGGDTNHPTPDSYRYWTDLYDSLSDTILQPFLGKSGTENTHPFLFFGVDKNTQNLEKKAKEFDILYVGNNWYRWHDVEWLIQTLGSARSKLNRIALIGRYWDGEIMEEFKEATISNPNLLEKNNVEIYKSAPYGHVEKTMGRGKLNPIFVRPILNKLNLVTPRMFETLMADTIPLIPNSLKIAPNLYGKNISKFIMSKDSPRKDIFQILENCKNNMKIVNKIKNKLIKDHSYESRLKQLLQYV